MRWIGEWWSRQGLAGVILSELICSGVWVWWMRRRLIPPTFGVGGRDLRVEAHPPLCIYPIVRTNRHS